MEAERSATTRSRGKGHLNTYICLTKQKKIEMDLELKGKKALVTGSTAGIGLAIAQNLAIEGASVIVTGRTQEKLDRTVSELTAHGTSVRGILVDLTTSEGAAAFFKQVPAIDILVNNLGIYELKRFDETSDEDWLKLHNVNVMSGVRLSRYYLPGMLDQGWGRVIFISSEAALVIPPELIHYSATKAAQLALSRGLAETTKGTGVTVNTVIPGPTRSEGIVEFLAKMASNPKATPEEAEKEFFEKHRATSLLQRLIDSKEVANLVAYVASPLSAGTNGAALRVEGGLIPTAV
jgi:NAD(P)-dependent dehydrogenase (short-subunit alcohol dehydrogenase family)